MFDNSKPNIILLTDNTEPIVLMKLFGPSKIACELRKAGFEVAVINHLHVFTLEEIKNILRKLVNENTLYIGVSPFFYNKCGAVKNLEDNEKQGSMPFDPKEHGSILPHGVKYNKEICDLIKSANPQCKLVVGGPDGQDRSYNSIYDYVVIGYGDVSAVNLARHLYNGEPLIKSYRSIYGFTVIDDRLASSYDFVSQQSFYQSHDCILPGETLLIEIGRGCVFRCGFCSYPLNGKKKNDHVKLSEVIYREFVDNYERFKITRYLITDDTFNDNIDKIKMLHDVSKRLPFQLEYMCFMRLDLLSAHPGSWDIAYDSGVRVAFFGIETLHEQAGKMCGKGGNKSKHIAMLKYIKQKYGNSVHLQGGFIFGLPGEPIESMKDTAELLVSGEIQLDSWTVSALRLHPKNASYTSNFDLNPEKYGYEIIEDTHGGNRLTWRNQYTDFYECDSLAEETNERGAIVKRTNKILGSSSMFIAGLGYDLGFSLNKDRTTFDWYSVDLRKQQRANEYKAMLYKELNII